MQKKVVVHLQHKLSQVLFFGGGVFLTFAVCNLYLKWV